ncbi:MAG: fibronectin type III domain-containing protein [Candidatus Aenigmatarchaeota archaeon]|nr:MAG: fibronectin type III domain-containing protein [Candidatus Aenigmarchaeota archaeon]
MGTTILLDQAAGKWLMFYNNGTEQFTNNPGLGTVISMKTAPVVGGSPPDSTPPSIPQNLNAVAVTDNQIDLTWDASSDPESGISRYYIYRDSVNVGQSTTTSYSDIGLTPSTTYTYEVSAVNGAGLESSKSDSSSATTLEDTTPPVRSNGQPTGTLPAATTQTTISLDTDEAATCKYDTTPNTSYAAMPNTFSTTGGLSHSQLITGLTNGSSHNYYVRCQDTLGNTDTNDFTISFSVASQPPSDLNVTNINPSNYETAYLVEGDDYYIDRTYTITNIPSAYEGLLWIKTANNDKGSTGDNFLTFDVNKDVTVYVGYASISPIPAWLNTWTEENQQVTTTILNYDLYSKNYSAGQIGLGGNEGGDSMYIVLLRDVGGAVFEAEDVNQDGTVDMADLILVGQSVGGVYDPLMDVNDDLYVNLLDLILVVIKIIGPPPGPTCGDGTCDADETCSTCPTDCGDCPPVRSNGQPTGTLPAGTNQTTISLDTDEDATCKYDTTSGTSYSAMPNTFSTTGGTSHSQLITSLTNGSSYTYYVRCQDTSGNANTDDYLISFSVASSPPTGVWENEPAGFIEISDRPFNSLTEDPQWTHQDECGQGVIENDPAAPLSPPNVLAKVYPPGSGCCGAEASIEWIVRTDSEFFAGWYYKIESGFQMPDPGHELKEVMWQTTPENSGHNWPSSGGSGTGPTFTWDFRWNHVGNGGTADTWIGPTLNKGQWYKFELHIVHGGEVKGWVDGELAWSGTPDWTGTTGFEAIIINDCWGGCVGDSVDNEQRLWYDHFYLSAPP